MDESSLVMIRFWVDRLREGDDAARAELIRHADNRLTRLTRRMLKDFPRLNRWEQSGDVCQNASLRLWRALGSVRPPDVADFFRLAALQIRRELIDLARRYYGPEGLGANHASNQAGDASGTTPPPLDDREDSTNAPDGLAAWAVFHVQVEALPDEPRTTFDLLWYQGLSQVEAAAVLGVSEPTIKRRWRAARVRLAAALDGEPPG